MGKKLSAFDSRRKTVAGKNLGQAVLASVRGVWKGSLDGRRLRCTIIVSRFNLDITQRLLLGAVDGLRRCGVKKNAIDVVWTPGAFEIPQAALRIAKAKRAPDAVVCLGAVMRGETPHFEYVARESARGIGSVALQTGIPVVFGVLTTNTIKQALVRAGGARGNKGWDAALTAVEMCNLFSKMRGR